MSKSHSQASDTVQPIYLSSERELSAEFQNFYKFLSDIEADWSKRIENLHRLKALILGGCTEYETFYPLLHKLAPGLNAQLNDLRSSISKETGQIICMISEVCQEKLEGISDKLLHKDALIKLINNANKILSEVGHQCICSLIENVKSAKFITKIQEEITTKNSAVRAKCATYLELILKNYPSQILEKQTNNIEFMIEKLICDANKETRITTRQAFYEYEQLFPTKAQKLFNKFDLTTQKTVKDEQSSKSNDTNSMKERPKSQNVSKASTNNNFNKTSGFANKTLNNNNINTNNKTPDRKSDELYAKKQGNYRTANSSTVLNGDDENTTYKEEAEDLVKAMKSEKNIIKKEAKPQSNVNGNKIKSYNKEEKNARTIKDNNSYSNNNSNNANNIQQKRTYNEINQFKFKPQENYENSDDEAEKLCENNKKPVSSQEIRKKILYNLNEKQKNESFHLIDKNREPQEKIIENSENNRELYERNYEKYEENIEKKAEKQVKNIKSQKETGKNEEEVTNKMMERLKLQEEELESLSEKTENPNWSVRATSFEKICDILSEINKTGPILLSKTLIQRLLTSHISHLLDPHFKVVQACLNSLTKLITLYYDCIFVTNLESLVANLLVNLADNRDQIYSKANVLLNLLEKLFSGDDLVGALYKSLESTTKIKVKICALEAMMLVIKNCETYFASYTNVKSFVVKIANLITENLQFKQILLPCYGVLLALKEKNSPTMMNCIISLAPNLISNLRLMAAQIAPDLEESIKDFIAKTMKEVKRESKPFLNKQVSKEENTNSLTTNFPEYSENTTIKPPSNENIMEIEEEKAPLKPSSSKNLSLQINTNEAISTKKRTSLVEFEDIKKIENLLKDIKGNNELIINEINNILITLAKYLESNISKYQDISLKLMKKLFTYFDNYQKLLPDSITRLLNLYHLNYQDTHNLDELLEILIPKASKITFLKALVDKTAEEKSPYLQIMIKWVNFIVKMAVSSEIKPFLDHLIDIFKIAINDASPDVRKSVVFCMVDLYFLLKHEIEPYFQTFHPNQQKLIMIYIKRKAEK